MGRKDTRPDLGELGLGWAAARWGFSRWGFSDLIENLSFGGSGRFLGDFEAFKKVGGEAPHLFGWF